MCAEYILNQVERFDAILPSAEPCYLFKMKKRRVNWLVATEG